MDDFSLLDVSAAAGLVATVALTVNYLLGMMLGTAYRQAGYWQKLPAAARRVSVNDLHNWTAYVALALAVVHPLLVVVDKTTKFTLADALFPVHAPHQKLFVAAGTVSFYALLVVIVTTQKAIKRRMGFRAWKNVHLLFIVHGVVMDPLLKDRPVDFFDAEKVLSEACALVLVVATVYRIRYQIVRNRKAALRVAG